MEWRGLLQIEETSDFVPKGGQRGCGDELIGVDIHEFAEFVSGPCGFTPEANVSALGEVYVHMGFVVDFA